MSIQCDHCSEVLASTSKTHFVCRDCNQEIIIRKDKVSYNKIKASGELIKLRERPITESEARFMERFTKNYSVKPKRVVQTKVSGGHRVTRRGSVQL